MFSLIREPPTSIIIGGRSYGINTDYRIMIKFENAVHSADISDNKAFAEIFTQVISDLFDIQPTGEISEIISKVMWYYRCGDEPRDGEAGGKKPKRCYDYEEDADYIYSAFRQQYGIDLLSANMHWWTFRGLFLGLTEDTEIVKIMQYRCADLSKIKNKAEKARIKRLQERFALKERKIRHFSSVDDRNAAYKERISRRYAEAMKRARESDANG